MGKLILLLMLSMLLHAEVLEPVSLQLKWKYQFQFAGFIMAKEKGFYREAGLDVTFKEFEEGINITDEVLHAKSDFGISDSALIYDALQGKAVVGLMPIFQNSPFILMGLRSAGIKTLKDINGRRLSLSKGLEGIAIQTMLKSNGIVYEATPPIFDLKQLKEGKVDMMIAYISNEPYLAKMQNLEVDYFVPKNYGFEAYGDILFTSQAMLKAHPDRVKRFYEATKRGWEYVWHHKQESIDRIYQDYNTLSKTKEALIYEANTLQELSGFGINFGQFDREKVKSIAQIINLIKGVYYPLSTLDRFIYHPNKGVMRLLTAQEQAYIREKKTVRICYDKTFYPFSYSEKGNASGSAVEMSQLILRTVELDAEFVETDNWILQLKSLKNSICDMNLLAMRKPNYYTFLTPTSSYIEDNLVFVTKIDQPYIVGLEALKNQKIGIKYGFENLRKHLQTLYPSLQIVSIADHPYQKVESGEIFAYVSFAYTASSKIAKEYSGCLKIMGKAIAHPIEGSFGVSNREPLLLSILDKALEMTSIKEREAILNHWYSVTIEEHRNYQLIWQIVGGFLLLLIVILGFVVLLRENNKKLQKLINSTIEGVIVFKDGRVQDANPQALKLFGYHSHEEMRGVGILEFVSSHSRSLVKEKIQGDAQPYRAQMRRKDGTTFPALIKGIYIDRAKRIRISTTIDLSKLKKTQNELRSLNTHLKRKIKEEVVKNREKDKAMFHQTKLAQMGEMISMIAHQWRQPLTAISATASDLSLKVMLEKYEPSYFTQKLEKIGSFSQYLSTTIDDFREFYKEDKACVEVEYATVVKGAMDIIATSIANCNITLKVECHSHKRVSTYPNELRQVILNLLKNAEDILIEKRVADPYIRVVTYDEAEYATLEVYDNGGGVPKEILDRIFDPYFSTKSKKDGMGLGLYMSKTIIEEHCGGILSVSNTPEGACFCIQIPLAEEKLPKGHNERDS